MIDKEILVYLRLAHGAFNTLVFSFIIYQGLLGYRIRKARLTGIQPGTINKRHRHNGPILVALGITGFFAGMLLAYLDYGHLLKYPLHFINGSTISTALVGMLLISKKIKGAAVPWRRAHLTLGIVTVFLYCLQILLGLSILL